MTVATIIYDATGGSDTAASGSGPATAITGASATNGAGNVVNLDGAPLLSFASNSVLWVNSAAGNRHLSRITAVNDIAKTVTTEDLLTLGAGVSWAVGGKRKTLEADTTRRDFLDGKAGWTYSLEAGTYTLTGAPVLPAVGDTTSGELAIVAASGAAPVISWTGDHAGLTVVSGTHLRLAGLTLSNTTSVDLNTIGVRLASGTIYVEIADCTIRTAGNCINSTVTVIGSIRGCDLKSTHGEGIDLDGASSVSILNNSIHECGLVRAVAGEGVGIKLDLSTGTCGCVVIGNIIRDNYASGITLKSSSPLVMAAVLNNVIHDNGADGIYLTGALAATYRAMLVNNLITNNGGYGINVNSTSGGDMAVWNDNNGFRGNANGEVLNVTKGAASLTLAADPYYDEAVDNYTLDPGGASVDAGYGY